MENKKYTINVYSEIGKLKTVLVHRPGDEFSNLTPDLLARLLFDDTPDLRVARDEHDYFCKLLTTAGVEVLYIEKLVAELIKDNPPIFEMLFNAFMKECGVKPNHQQVLATYLKSFDHQAMVNKMIAGVTKYELGIKDGDDYPLVIDPLPNLLFQRDPFAAIGNGATVNRMFSETRRRETLFSDFVLKYHHRFKDKVNFWYERDEHESIEGGDVLVLNNTTLIIGATQRTTVSAIEIVAKNIINSDAISYEKVIILDLQSKTRAYMHLDTVLTNIDHDKFLVHPLIFEDLDQFKIFEITKHGKQQINTSLLDYFAAVIGKPVQFIKCGGEDPINQAREQWNDATNVITILPGEVISYNRNPITNQLMRQAGIKVHEILSAELSRGRGGPRCMTMPIWRDDIKDDC